MSTASVSPKQAHVPKQAQSHDRDMPWQLWIVIALLAVEGIGNLVFAMSHLVGLYWFAAKCLFILGFLRGWRPVFVIFMLTAAYHVLFFAGVSSVASLLNLVMMVCVASSARHFFVRVQGPA